MPVGACARSELATSSTTCTERERKRARRTEVAERPAVRHAPVVRVRARVGVDCGRASEESEVRTSRRERDEEVERESERETTHPASPCPSCCRGASGSRPPCRPRSVQVPRRRRRPCRRRRCRPPCARAAGRSPARRSPRPPRRAPCCTARTTSRSPPWAWPRAAGRRTSGGRRGRSARRRPIPACRKRRRSQCRSCEKRRREREREEDALGGPLAADAAPSLRVAQLGGRADLAQDELKVVVEVAHDLGCARRRGGSAWGARDVGREEERGRTRSVRDLVGRDGVKVAVQVAVVELRTTKREGSAATREGESESERGTHLVPVERVVLALERLELLDVVAVLDGA